MGDVSDELTATLAHHAEQLAREGYTIVRDAFDADLAHALHADIDRLEQQLGIGFGGNGFEGHATTRVYNLLALGELYSQVPVHPIVLPLMHHLLGSGCLVSSLSAITIHPGEIAQPIHADDQVIPLAKPHAPLVCNSMWALTDFTEAITPPPTGSTTTRSAPRCRAAASSSGMVGCGTAAAPTSPITAAAGWR